MSLFNQIFHKKPNEPALADFSALGVDIHSHLVPGIDDGSDKVETSLEIMRGFENLGFKKMITTPHIMEDFYKNNPEVINTGLEVVRKAALSEGITLKLEAAAEYNIDDGFEKKFKNDKLMTFGDNYILVELSTFTPHPNLLTILFNLQLEGYRIVLAHAERYSYWYDDMKGYEELRDRDVLFQVNLLSFISNHKPAIKKMAEKLASHDMIDFLGSDIHNPGNLRYYQGCLSDNWIIHLVRSGRLLNSSLL